MVRGLWRRAEGGEDDHARLFPGSIVAEYLERAPRVLPLLRGAIPGNSPEMFMPVDLGLLVDIARSRLRIMQQRRTVTPYGTVGPAPLGLSDTFVGRDDTLVVHVRVGDVLDWPGTGFRPSAKSVAELLGAPLTSMFDPATTQAVVAKQERERGRGNVDFSWYVRPLAFYAWKAEKMRQHGITRVVLVAGTHVPCGACERSYTYLQALKGFFEGLGMDVTLALGAEPDTDIAFMAAAKYFVPSAGGFSMIIAAMVRHGGGVLL